MDKKAQSAFLYVQLSLAAIVTIVVIAVVWGQVENGSSTQGAVIFGVALFMAVVIAAVLVRKATRRR